MTLIVPDEGKVFLIKRSLNIISVEDLRLRLYTNDVTPAQNSVFSTFTEASGFGYSGVTLVGSSYTVVSGVTASYPQQTFTFSGALGKVYGYFVTGGVTLGWAERFTNGPYNVANSGDQIKLTPTMGVK